MPTAKPTHGPAADTTKPGGKGNRGADGNHTGSGHDATHKPTAGPSHAARASSAGNVTDNVTPDPAKTADSHKGSSD